MSCRALAIGHALQELEPDILNLTRLAHLVAEHAGDVILPPRNGQVVLSEKDAEAIQFGIYEMQRRADDIRAKFALAFESAPAE
jgi:hypothetical protein